MCGIAGVIAWDERFATSPETLQKMRDAIAHRGPDDQRIWINHQNSISPQNPQAALAHARLAIIDLDPRANQPMTDGRRWMVFNGEIYNFAAVREELTRIHPDYQWKTTGDSEVILRAYDAWGKGCLDHLNGQFAFAIFDPQERAAFLARDRMGEKPLYFALATDNRAIAFASEIGALRPLSWPDWTIDPQAIGQYLRNGFICQPATVYRGIHKLPPASWLHLKQGQTPERGIYFDANKMGDSAISVSDVKNAVLTAVRRALVSDVPLGCFLSGGIDSSVIAAAMKSVVEKGQRVLTFSIGFDDPRYDETPYAAEVARHLGTEHRQFIVTPDAAADLPKLAAVYGEPFGDSSALPTHYLSRETRKHVTVALSGDGGDELFGGYDRYRAMSLGASMGWLRHPLHFASALLPSRHPKSAASRLKRFTRTLGLPPAARYSSYLALFDSEWIRHLYPPAENRDEVAESYAKFSAGRDVVQAALATDRVVYLPEDLLTKVDRASMLHALEVRAPFMDYELVNLAAGLTTPKLLAGGGKRLLREAFAADLPASVFSRPKMGFAVPIGDWLRTSLQPMLRDLLDAADSFAKANYRQPAIRQLIEEHMQNRIDHSQRLYALLMLELWWRMRKR